MKRKASKKLKQAVVTIEALAIMTQGGFDALNRRISNVYDELSGAFSGLENTVSGVQRSISNIEHSIFALDSKLQSIDNRLKRVGQMFEPFLLSYKFSIK